MVCEVMGVPPKVGPLRQQVWARRQERCCCSLEPGRMQHARCLPSLEHRFHQRQISNQVSGCHLAAQASVWPENRIQGASALGTLHGVFQKISVLHHRPVASLATALARSVCHPTRTMRANRGDPFVQNLCQTGYGDTRHPAPARHDGTEPQTISGGI